MISNDSINSCCYQTYKDFQSKNNKVYLIASLPHEINEIIAKIFFRTHLTFTKDAINFSLVNKNWSCIFFRIKNFTIERLVSNISCHLDDDQPSSYVKKFFLNCEIAWEESRSEFKYKIINWKNFSRMINFWNKNYGGFQDSIDGEYCFSPERDPRTYVVYDKTVGDVYLHQATPYIILCFKKLQDSLIENLDPENFVAALLTHKEYQLAVNYVFSKPCHCIDGTNKNHLIKILIEKIGYDDLLKFILMNEKSITKNVLIFTKFFFHSVLLGKQENISPMKMDEHPFLQSLNLLKSLPRHHCQLLTHHILDRIHKDTISLFKSIKFKSRIIIFRSCLKKLCSVSDITPEIPLQNLIKDLLSRGSYTSVFNLLTGIHEEKLFLECCEHFFKLAFSETETNFDDFQSVLLEIKFISSLEDCEYKFNSIYLNITNQSKNQRHMKNLQFIKILLDHIENEKICYHLKLRSGICISS